MHKPVLLDEVIQFLSPVSGEVYVDCTFGAGGYTRAILESSDCKVIAFDMDPNVQILANKMKLEFKDRFFFIQANFADMEEEFEKNNIDLVDGIIFDLGVSSMQLDQAERGFSFSKEASLDMRMSSSGRSAMDFVNQLDEKEMADIIYNYGDENFSRKIASNILKARLKKKIETTTELAEIVRYSLPAKFKGHKTDPATKTFQAIRIWVNDELNSLKNALESSKKLLKNGGRLVVVTFHSGEDKIVKSFMNENSGKVQSVSRYFPDPIVELEKRYLQIITKKAVAPKAEEIVENIRSRSAKLRAAILVEREGDI
jgi:16S rRNA (cytosine1402-N4)-methyltransferase